MAGGGWSLWQRGAGHRQNNQGVAVKSFDEHSDLYSLFYTDLKSYFLNTGKVQGLYNNETLESKT